MSLARWKTRVVEYFQLPRITGIKELSVPLEGGISNAVINFSGHTVSLVAVFSDVIRHGAPVVGLAFNSIGRFAQSGIINERLIPRILNADPDRLMSADGQQLDPRAVWQIVMSNEKPGGHGDRAGAVAAIELAIWDLNAKLADLPAWASIAEHNRRPVENRGVPTYAAGGYYYAEDSINRLVDELKTYRDIGFNVYKIKIGGTSLATDLARLDAAISFAGDGSRVAVDANGRFDLETADVYLDALSQRQIRWYEEPGDPLDYNLMQHLAFGSDLPLATGENLFSRADTVNLLRYGGLRQSIDIFQMDPGLSYGLLAYIEMLEALEAAGHTRQQCYPHGGHLINLHIAAGLGLGGCEAYPGVFQPFGGFSPACVINDGMVIPSDAPGFGLEHKRELQPYITRLLNDV